jgi:Asp-tRNA(Asn)/Glu-tRNA(Gln) amidotransferase A subunit family amidase
VPADAGVADAVDRALATLHELDARTHAIEWFEDRRVRTDALALDATDRPRGPLHGVPVTVKDWIDVVGFPCAGGSPVHRDRRPTEDASVVARLRSAGAIVVAKTKPWDGWDPDGPVVAHPVDASRYPGGSSTGDAVVTAAGAVPLGVGSDSGGSVRLPAAWCGVLGLKPTTGRVPGTGHFPRFGDRSDGRTTIGFLASDLGMIERALAVAAGADGLDAAAPPVPVASPTTADSTRVRVALLPPDPRWPVADAVTDACRRAVATLVDAGAARAEWSWPWLAEARGITAGYWQRAERSGAEAGSQLWDWDRFRRRYLVAAGAVDVLVSPVTADVAPLRSAIDERRGADGHVDLTDDFVFTLPASLTGSPAISVPMGVEPATGLPLAVQLIGKPWDDARLLAVARALTAS